MKETLVCSTRSYFSDDLIGFCLQCLRQVFYRPHSQGIKRRLCLPCGIKEMKENKQMPVMTAETLAELRKIGILQ